MKGLLSLICFVLLFSCQDQKGPDVSGIDARLKTARFEKDFFEMDTNDISKSINSLYQKYPVFLRDFLQNILGLATQEQSVMAVSQFLRDYRPIYDSVNKQFRDLDNLEKEIENGLKHVKYYFPSYKIPRSLITFIGPMDAIFQGSLSSYGDAITQDALAIGLQLHLGANFSMYHSEMGLALYPAYVSRKFAPEYIPVNCIKNVIDDLYPDNSAEKTLIEQMVEKGKRLYLLDKFMPATADSLKIGYSDKQLKGCYANEGLIWNYFIKNGLVYNNDPSLIKNYIGESPNTPEFGEGAPGNIGLFVGWQIVKKYMAENKTGSLSELMQLDAKQLFENSRYRPK